MKKFGFTNIQSPAHYYTTKDIKPPPRGDHKDHIIEFQILKFICINCGLDVNEARRFVKYFTDDTNLCNLSKEDNQKKAHIVSKFMRGKYLSEGDQDEIEYIKKSYWKKVKPHIIPILEERFKSVMAQLDKLMAFKRCQNNISLQPLNSKVRDSGVIKHNEMLYGRVLMGGSSNLNSINMSSHTSVLHNTRKAEREVCSYHVQKKYGKFERNKYFIKESHQKYNREPYHNFRIQFMVKLESTGQCFCCGDVGHVRYDCPFKNKCLICGKDYPVLRSCRMLKNRNYTQTQRVVCIHMEGATMTEGCEYVEYVLNNKNNNYGRRMLKDRNYTHE